MKFRWLFLSLVFIFFDANADEKKAHLALSEFYAGLSSEDVSEAKRVLKKYYPKDDDLKLILGVRGEQISTVFKKSNLFEKLVANAHKQTSRLKKRDGLKSFEIESINHDDTKFSNYINELNLVPNGVDLYSVKLNFGDGIIKKNQPSLTIAILADREVIMVGFELYADQYP